MLVPLSALWLPILLSAVVAWIVSALVWTVMPHHKTDFKQIPDEDKVLEAMRTGGLGPGSYFFPYMKDRGKMNDPACKAKMEKGPMGTMIVMPPSALSMGKPMVLQFVYFLLASVLIAYVGAVSLAPGTSYLTVFRVIGTTAILAYAGAHAPRSIWFGRPWANTFKELVDGLVYGLLTAGIFGSLWP